MTSNPEPKGVIFDVGYRQYDGRYLGRFLALASLVWDDFKRALGFKRKTGYRIGIIVLFFFQLGAAGVSLFRSEIIDRFFVESGAPEAFQNTFSNFYEFTGLLVLIMAAIVAPNLLCRDRKGNVFQLYLVRPIQPYDYLAAKSAAIFLVLLLFVMGPNIILFIGKVFLAPDTIQFVSDHFGSLLAIIISGLLIALFFASYSIGIASLTTSIGAAAGLTIGILFLVGTVSDIVYLSTRDSSATILNLNDAIYRIKDWIFFGEPRSFEVNSHGQTLLRLEPLGILVYSAISFGVIIGSGILAWLTYRREVRR